jgi:hypothetical protein
MMPSLAEAITGRNQHDQTNSGRNKQTKPSSAVCPSSVPTVQIEEHSALVVKILN